MSKWDKIRRYSSGNTRIRILDAVFERIKNTQMGLTIAVSYIKLTIVRSY